ncbi:MAG: hypothetical protein RLZZ15_4399 [Verrucomicrobiota bacterium]|jgi:tetratricopeptide (TPR) repeat protein
MHPLRPARLRLAATLAIAALTATAPALFAAVAPADLAAARALYDAPGKTAEAQAAFDKLAAAEPKDVDVIYHLGHLANRRDVPDQAQKLFERGLALAPDDARLQHGLGDAFGRQAQKASIFSQMGLAKKCVAAYERAVALAPANADFQQSLFEFYRQAPGLVGGGTDKALATAATIKKLDPQRGRMAYATLYAADKKFDLAFAEFDEALKTAPDDYAALYQLGKLAAQTGQQLDRGLTALRRCLELPVPAAPNTPAHFAAHWRIGMILEQKKDVPGARAAYETALKLEPKFAQAAESLKKLK